MSNADLLRDRLADIPTLWLEQCLTAIALDPDTAQPSVGLPVRPHVAETHQLRCGACRNPWHPIKPTDDDPAWYGRCVTCDSADLIVESEPIPGAPHTGEWHLTCNACAATWVGIPGDPCTWCQEALDRQQDYQAELLLKPPEVDRDDANYDDRMRGWIERMKVGAQAGLITEKQAETAWQRTQRRVV